jgi:outer membrane protein TolC
MYRSLLSFLFSALFWQQTLAQKDTSMNFSLKQAVEYAKSNSYIVKNAKLDEKNAKAKVKETLATGLPQVNGAVNFNKNFQLTPFYFNLNLSSFTNSLTPAYEALLKGGLIDTATLLGLSSSPGEKGSVTRAGANITGNANITVNQLLFDGSYLVGLQASKEFVKLSQQFSAKTEQDAEINVSKSYYLVLIAEENISLLESNLSQLEKTLKDTRALYVNGFVEKTDVDRLELAVSNLKLQRDKLHDQKEIATKLLKMQMGIQVNEPIYLTDKLEDLYKNNLVLTEKVTPNPSNRIEYQLLNQQVYLNKLNMKRYRTGFLPTLSAVYNIAGSSYRDANFNPLTKFGWYSSSFVGVSMSVPLFDGFRKQSWMQQTHITLDKLENDKKNFENAVALETYQAQTNYESSIKQTEIRKSNMKLAENIYASVSAKFKNGVGSSFELTQAETELKTAQINYLTAIYDLMVARIELNKALGKPVLN